MSTLENVAAIIRVQVRLTPDETLILFQPYKGGRRGVIVETVTMEVSGDRVLLWGRGHRMNKDGKASRHLDPNAPIRGEQLPLSVRLQLERHYEIAVRNVPASVRILPASLR
jgi:hypothetical protein